MSRECFDAVEELFNAALERPAGEREAFLCQAATDADVRHEVTRLLSSHAEAFDWFEELGGAVAEGSVTEVESASREGTQIGPYRLVRVIGYGGMGTVFLAERADGAFEQRVALKLIRRGLETGRATERFFSERRILARLQHPNVAGLLDGGITDDGCPFYVMEYVEGVPITDYCDEHRLPLDERLQLFLSIGEAVQYAHANLVVHRDLKPGHVLVTEEGTVKLIDFGIAKLLGEDDGITRSGESVLTPLYAAPEQLQGEPVTTATDVYALGLILFELLTGRTPHGESTESAVQITSRLLSGDLPRPSTVVEDKTDEPGVEVRAAARATRPSNLRRLLTGDLDNICMMALERQPERRFRSAEQLTEDVRRFLADLPVTARRQTAGYRLTKFARRHRVGMAASVALASVLVASTVTVSVQARRVANEADRAKRSQELLIDLLRTSDPNEVPNEASGGTITAQELLDRGVAAIEERFADQPDTRASLLDALGRIYQNLGLYERAQPLLERALGLRRETGAEPLEIAASLDHLGTVLYDQGEYDAAQAPLEKAVALYRRQRGADLGLADGLEHLGAVLFKKGDHEAAEPLFREALSLRSRDDPEDVRISQSLSHLALLEQARGSYAEAEALQRQVLERRLAAFGEDDPRVADTLNNLASTLARQGELRQAREVFSRALSVRRAVYGESHPLVATSFNNLATVMMQLEEHDLAEEHYLRALEVRRQVLEPSHPDLAQSLSNLGLLWQATGRLDEALAAYEEALAIRRRAFGENHMRVAQTYNNLGLLRQAMGDLEQADIELRRSRTMMQELLGPEHPMVATTINNLASVAHQRGDLDAAEALYRQALAMRRNLLTEGHPHTAYSLVGLGQVLAERGDHSAAEPLLAEALAIRRASLPEDSPLVVEVLEAIQANVSNPAPGGL